MDRFYQDIPLSPRSFPYSGPRPRSAVIPNLPAHHGNYNRMPAVGGNSPYHSSRSYSAHYDRYRVDMSRYLNHPPPVNMPRSNYNPFCYDGNYSRTNFHPNTNHYHTGPAFDSPVYNNNVFQTNMWQFRKYQNSHVDLHSKKNESTEQDKQKEAEAVKKASLAAKLKKSLETFKKNPSYKKKNLSIINKSDANRSSKYTSEIKPCFRWDLPLTVDDLKTIRRCPSNSECDALPNSGDDSRIAERLERSFDTEPIPSSPDIIYVKHSRKRKLSESAKCSIPKRRILGHRRRHRSASPKLCLENSTVAIDDQSQFSSGPSSMRDAVDNGSLPIRTNESPSSKGKSLQSSNVMQLLGVKRREFDELVNQPRSPRVQFMLGLLMKRHKELLLQRAMRSRISNVSNQEGASNQDEEQAMVPEIDPPSLVDKPIKLEGRGASDTIDQLSNILLESSLAVDISSLPQELIDQLGTFLELGAESVTHHTSAGESSDGDSVTFVRGSDYEGLFEGSGNLADTLSNPEERISHDTIRCKSEIPEMGVIHSERTTSKTDHNHESFVSFRQKKQNNITIKREILPTNETSENHHSKTCHLVGRNSSQCMQKSSESPLHVLQHENVPTVEEHSKQNYASNYSHPILLNNDIMEDEMSARVSDDQIMMKIWSIDAKIFELTQEKKIWWQKLWKRKGMLGNISQSGDQNAAQPQGNDDSTTPEFENMPRLSSPCSVNPNANSPAASSVVQGGQVEGSTVINAGDESSCPLPKPTNSNPSECISENTSAVNAEIRQLSTPLKSNLATHFQCHGGMGKKLIIQGPSSGSALDHFHNELPKANAPLDGDFTEESSINSKSAGADAVSHHDPVSVDSDPEIEILDEPVEIIYDSNDPTPTRDKSGGEFVGHKDSILQIKAVKDYLFACCADFCIHCYDINTCKLIQTYQGHKGIVTCLHVDFYSSRKRLYTGSHDQFLHRYGLKDGTLQYTKKLTEPIQCMASNWGFLFLGTKKGKIEKYHLKTCDFTQGLSSMENEIMALQTSREGPRNVLIVAPRNMPMVVRDANTGLLLRAMSEDMLQHTTYSLFAYQGFIFAGTSTYGVKKCDFTTGKVVQTYTGCGSIVAVKVSDGRLYAASYDGKIYIYDLQCSSPKHIIQASDKLLLCMDQRDDKIFAGSVTGELKFWKVP